jgi:NADH dehydrogenase (ubiquinone) 1 alpha subcomplex subunit 12
VTTADRKRYVVYAKKDFDASQVPAEWHAWLHYISDEPPTTGKYSSLFFQKAHTENLSGTPQRYVPYSTVGPKIIRFDPKQLSNGPHQSPLPE